MPVGRGFVRVFLLGYSAVQGRLRANVTTTCIAGVVRLYRTCFGRSLPSRVNGVDDKPIRTTCAPTRLNVFIFTRTQPGSPEQTMLTLRNDDPWARVTRLTGSDETRRFKGPKTTKYEIDKGKSVGVGMV